MAAEWYTGDPTVNAAIEDALASQHTSDAALFVPLAKAINAQTGTTYTPALTDIGKIITLNNASAIALTLPQDSTVAFPIGIELVFLQIGAGLVTAAAGSGATAHKTAIGTSLAFKGQYAKVTATKVAANTWNVNGELANT